MEGKIVFTLTSPLCPLSHLSDQPVYLYVIIFLETDSPVWNAYLNRGLGNPDT